MILYENEIQLLLSLIGNVITAKYPLEMGLHQQEQLIEHISENPHLLSPFDFDQNVIVNDSNNARAELSNQFKISAATIFTPSIRKRLLVKRKNSTTWMLLHSRLKNEGWGRGEFPSDFVFISADTGDFTLDLLDFRKYYFELSGSSLVLPQENLIIPSAYDYLSIHIANSQISHAARELIKKLFFQQIRLDSLSPNDLEDIVAEIFQDKGLKVNKTKRTRDGGRDLIVTGEIMPGEESQMAVEITTQQVVGIAKASKAIFQNRHFPLIMLATSGTFSSGVIKTANDPEFMYRLKLRDGKTILDWINEYKL